MASSVAAFTVGMSKVCPQVEQSYSVLPRQQYRPAQTAGLVIFLPAAMAVASSDGRGPTNSGVLGRSTMGGRG